MPVVGDFVQVVGDSPETIGSSAVELPFNTGGRDSDHLAFLIFSVRRLGTTVPVKVNNVNVGSLTPNSSQNHWFTQMIHLDGGKLNDGGNELQLEAVNNDQFEIRQVTCFFGQSA